MRRLEKGYEIIIIIITGVVPLFFIIQGWRTESTPIVVFGIVGFFLLFPFLVLYYSGLIFKKEE
jgi:hypothetical protein